MTEKVKILIIRFSSIGDIVLCSPVVRCLKEQIHGDSEIHFLTKSEYRQILEHNPNINHIHSIEKSTNELIDDLKKIEFDYVIDLHHNLRTMRVKSRLKAMNFSFNKLNPLKWLLVNFKVNKMPKLHIVDRYLDTVKALGIENDGKGLDYFLPSDEKTPELPSTFKDGYVALVLSATHNTKKPKDQHFWKLVEEIKAPVVLIGGQAEAELGAWLTSKRTELLVNMAGQCNLHQSALLIKEAKSVITPDTGMMHIAAAFSKPIYSVWGNTVPDFGMYPYLPKGKENLSHIFEVKGLSCRPCSKIGFQKCPKGHFKCMENQDWSLLAQQAQKLS